MRFLTLILAFWVTSSLALSNGSIILYQPDPILGPRLDHNVKGLADYIGQLRSIIEADTVGAQEKCLSVVVGLNPDGARKFWFTTDQQDLDRPLLVQKLQKVSPVAVKFGPIAFAVAYGDKSCLHERGVFKAPIPFQWNQALRTYGVKNAVLPDSAMALIMPMGKSKDTNQHQIEDQILEFLIHNLSNVDEKFANVIAYAKSLKDYPTKDPDSLTIYSNLYWKAFVSMAISDPSLELSRMALLARDGQMAKTNYIYAMASYRGTAQGLKSKEEFQSLSNLAQNKMIQTKALIDSGVRVFDRGDLRGAAILYEQALQIYPKDPRALYELGQVDLKNPDSNQRYTAHQLPLPRFIQSRTYDPFYTYAWQGNLESYSKIKILQREIYPILPKIYNHTASVAELKSFADNVSRLGFHEMAAYVDFYLFVLDPDEKFHFKRENIDRFAGEISLLGCDEAALYVKEQFNAMRQYEK